MCDTHSETDVATTYKNTFALATEFGESDTADAEAAKTALEACMNAEYAEQVEPVQTALDAAKDADNPTAIKAQEAALAAVKDEMGNLYPNGYARLNKALSGLENGTITFQKVAFDADRDNDGALDADDLAALGIENGDEVVVMVSAKDDGNTSRYVLVPTDSGHRACTCPDKVCNTTFPVCKHEIAWVLYQLTSPFLAGDVAVDNLTSGVTPDAKTVVAPSQ